MAVISSSFRARVRSSIEEPVARFFGRLGFTPNAVTLVGFGIAIVAAALAMRQDWVLAGLVAGFGAIFDLFDGALARATGKTSRFGAFLDSTFDRAGEAVVYLGIAWGTLAAGRTGHAGLAMAAMAAAFMVSYTRAKSESLGFTPGTGMANVGLAPREVRTAILVVGLIATGVLGGLANSTAVLTLGLSLGLIALLATITTIQRILFVYQQSKSETTQGKENQ
jgi:CDP-diacylglycerol---glycerol-3-phosphate 3-phosphatidyltransferase